MLLNLATFTMLRTGGSVEPTPDLNTMHIYRGCVVPRVVIHTITFLGGLKMKRKDVFVSQYLRMKNGKLETVCSHWRSSPTR